jgi:hypothetical protein
MHGTHACSNKCLRVNRDGTIICSKTGKCQEQFISRNDYNPTSQHLFQRYSIKTTTNATTNHPKQRDSPKKKHVPDQLILADENAYILSVVANILTIGGPGSTESRNQAVNQLKQHRETTDITSEIQTLFETLNDQNALAGKRKSVIIASLYLMRDGGKTYSTRTGSDYTISNRSDFLQAYLPSISELRLLGIRKNLVRIGSNLIQRIIRNI